MQKIVNKFLNELMKKNKKRFNLESLEKHIMASYKENQIYLKYGGYQEFYKQMMILKQENKIKEIAASDYNGYNPALKTKWQIIYPTNTLLWNQSKMLRMSDYLDFTYYIKYPSYQTEIELEYIDNIYKFLKSRDEKQWASIEERSLELFYDEKFLKNKKDINKGQYGILSRLKITREDLKMKKYGEMFIYWNKGVEDIKKIIILENHSTFFTYKKAAQTSREIFGFIPDAIIYGEGKKIEDSLSFIQEITNPDRAEILYFGDIDPEGLSIYYRLKERYSNMNIRLQHEAYKNLLELCVRDYQAEGQYKNSSYLDAFLEDMKPYIDTSNLEKITYIWNNDLRIPQELINYEYLLKVKK